ncbi:protein translocase subunit SecD [Candidatus Pantoea edessiphila]|uniref:Protein translocase subunit SecD n=1 Tax=Candidatus Pantoea edessiphila TaxID=2044610 RepID=A0A2P5SVI3_9GAMM|nr:protein translocase subunit SecD [Candidatus Pantoea edessiphila]PPI86345.1 protein translocase subunit SecD [Candidatus Pantoea edessiphila]
MLNRYPIWKWKYIFVFTILIVSLLYAIPNLYGEDPSVQVISKNGDFVNQNVFRTIKEVIQKNRIKYKSISLEHGIVTLRLNDLNTQLLAHDIIKKRIQNKYITSLNLIPATPNWFNWISAKPMQLGFDLRGGVELLIEVDIKNLVKNIINQKTSNLIGELRQKNILYNKIYSDKNFNIKIIFNNFYDCNQALTYLKSIHKELLFNINDHNIININISTSYINQLRENAIQQNIIILRNRINQLGISQSSIQRQGFEHILINLPGIQDISSAKKLIGTTATLEFRLVNTSMHSNLISHNIIPFDSEIKYTSNGQPVLLYKHVILTGNHITFSTASLDKDNNPEINIVLDSKGGDIMSNFTKDNIGKFIATLFIEYKDSGKKYSQGSSILMKNEEIINIANIQSQVSNNFRITGIKNLNSARQLAILLRAGALVTPIQIIEERTIGPTMGQKNISQGIKACLFSLFSCVIFMILFYKKFGLISVTTLLINLIIIIAITSLLPNVTLTMPGIAGIVLSLAVAIDANILINERIKEEIYNGCAIAKAINKGYKNALSSIIDSNITTLIKAIILYIFGIGSVRGFAIMTIIGIMTSMLTLVVFTKSIIDFFYSNRNIKNLSI